MSFQGFEESKVPAKKESVSDFDLKPNRKEKREKLLKSTNRNDKIVDVPSGAKLTPQESPSKVQLSISESGRCEVLSSKPAEEKPIESHKMSSQQKECSLPENFEIPPPDPSRSVLYAPPDPSRSVLCAPPDTLSQDPISKLEEFESKRKLIEEQNRKRREMLTIAINSRRKATHEESRRLEQAQQELAKIDMMLNTDVKFLRGAIEEASLQFMESQKRYDRAEKEFVDAKMHLFSTLERKELLTDHLCAIIEQNELRKAKKLEELMADLQLNEDMQSTK